MLNFLFCYILLLHITFYYYILAYKYVNSRAWLFGVGIPEVSLICSVILDIVTFLNSSYFICKMTIIVVYILQVMVRVSRLIYVKHLEQNLHIEALNKGLPLLFLLTLQFNSWGSENSRLSLKMSQLVSNSGEPDLRTHGFNHIP